MDRERMRGLDGNSVVRAGRARWRVETIGIIVIVLAAVLAAVVIRGMPAGGQGPSARVIATIAVGHQRHRGNLVIAPDGHCGYLAGPDSVMVLDAATGTIRARAAMSPSGEYPYELAISPDGRRLYAYPLFGDLVTVFDTTSLAIVATVPVGGELLDFQLAPDGRRGYALRDTPSGGSVLTELDVPTNTVRATIPIGPDPRPHFVISPDSRHLYAQVNPPDGSGQMIITDTDTDTVTATVPLGHLAVSSKPAISSDGRYLYLAGGHLQASTMVADDYLVVDTTTRAVVRALPAPLPEDPYALAVTPDGRRLYATAPDAGALIVLDTLSGKPSVLRGLGNPIGLAVSPTGHYAYLATWHPWLAVIDTTDNAVLARLPVAGSDLTEPVLSPNRQRLYVFGTTAADTPAPGEHTSGGDDTVSVIDTASSR